MRAIKVPTLVLQSSYNDAQLKRQPLLPGMKTPFMTLVAETLVDADIKAILSSVGIDADAEKLNKVRLWLYVWLLLSLSHSVVVAC